MRLAYLWYSVAAGLIALVAFALASEPAPADENPNSGSRPPAVGSGNNGIVPYTLLGGALLKVLLHHRPAPSLSPSPIPSASQFSNASAAPSLPTSASGVSWYPAVIHGTVTDEQNRPVAGASVLLRRRSARAPAQRVAQPAQGVAKSMPAYSETSAYVETDVNGSYAIVDQLKSGAYYLEVSARATAIERADQAIEATTNVVRNFILHPADSQTASSPYAARSVYYATDRHDAGSGPFPFEGLAAGNHVLSFGACSVSVPLAEEATNAPSGYRFERHVDPGRHSLVGVVSRFTPPDAFYSAMRAEHPARVLVFVHGYNQTFEQGIRTAGQFRYALGFDGPVVLYSWPSHGDLRQYAGDEDQAATSATAFIEFVERLSRELGSRTKILLAAHSMGNRLVTDLIEGGAGAKSGTTVALDQVVMAAPDVFTERFTSRLSYISPSVGHITIYASNRDQALLLSSIFHNDLRLGTFGHWPTIVRGMDTVDASQVDTSLLGHSYFADEQTVVADIRSALRGQALPRGSMERITVKEGLVYWRLGQP